MGTKNKIRMPDLPVRYFFLRRDGHLADRRDLGNVASSATRPSQLASAAWPWGESAAGIA